MNTTKLRTTAAALALSTTLPAFAGTTVPQLTDTQPVATSSSDSWQWRFDLYGWVEALDGDIMIQGLGIPVDLGFDDILENLDMAVMGALEVSRGRWSFQADVSYAEISGSSSGRRSYRRLGVDQLIGHGIVACTVFEDPATRVQVYGGVRVNSLDAEFDETTPLGSASFSGSETWVDPIIGVRAARELPNRFFLRALGDIGGFGVESDFTWQAMALLGYRLGEGSSILAGYRGIGTDYSDGSFAYDVISHGPILGFEFQF